MDGIERQISTKYNEGKKKERKHPLLPKYSCLKGNETFCDPQNASRLK